tara:strand:- start:2254 stop:2595 length:342 start_codon:yes stop_codon:yes gene_type:complete
MKELLIVFLLVNSLFWGLLPHDIHCDLCLKLGIIKCPPHIVLICISIVCFSTAIILSQEEYFGKLYSYSKSAVQNGGRIAKATGKLLSSTAGNFESLDDFTETVESFVEGATM